MTEFQERRLRIIETQIQSHHYTKNYFKRNWLYILILGLVISFFVFFMTNLSEIEKAHKMERAVNEFYAYNFGIGTFCFIIGAAVLGHILFNLQLNFLIQRLKKDKETMLKIINKEKLEFTRFEHFDEIGEED
ncbi:hypothetical protein [Aurantibacter aestuarii]|uniref:Uncharacterized protein n=1 Tax=Aurantibacter aestuarii TaxID=1266046 RepID=A0A2T1NFW8_9FLAO|nr:hypothetical protein [Aurantibacter aestuarii]PSG91687.1 hypothetical protein C7H52_00820 [Aurantibacter aestuarii]